jgi:hypothetical protein
MAVNLLPVATMENPLYFGDNLSVLKLILDSPVQLVYIDPPLGAPVDVLKISKCSNTSRLE